MMGQMFLAMRPSGDDPLPDLAESHSQAPADGVIAYRGRPQRERGWEWVGQIARWLVHPLWVRYYCIGTEYGGHPYSNAL
jgi:hypothetical protein